MRENRNLTLGLVLLLVGGYFVLSRTFDFSGPGAILVLIGAIFLALSALRGLRGPLLPGGVLLGLGAGFLLREPFAGLFPPWATILLGLGAGFLLVALLDRTAGRERRPSPIVPGAILIGIALVAALAIHTPLVDVLDDVRHLWPWALVLAGAVLLLQVFLKRRA